MSSISKPSSNGVSMIAVVSSMVAIGAVSYMWERRKRYKKNKRSSKSSSSSRRRDTGDLQQDFEAAAKEVSHMQTLSSGDKLLLYGLYKQSTKGDAPPGPANGWDVIANAKHVQWRKFKGMSQNKAMAEYIRTVNYIQGKDKNPPNEETKTDDPLAEVASQVVGEKGLGVRPSMPQTEPEPAPSLTLEEQLLDAAAKNEANKIQDELIPKGVDLQYADKSGQTALHLAADNGAFDALEVLLDEGANPAAADEEGISALQAAVIAGHVDCCQLLLDYGADPEQPDMDGDTPKSCARDDGSDAMKLLFDLF